MATRPLTVQPFIICKRTGFLKINFTIKNCLCVFPATRVIEGRVNSGRLSTAPVLTHPNQQLVAIGLQSCRQTPLDHWNPMNISIL